MPRLPSAAPLHAILDSAGYTPVDVFFAHHQRYIPQIDSTLWQLLIQGQGRAAHRFSLADLARFPQAQIDCTLYSRMTDRELHIGHARWGGVLLRDLLDGAGALLDDHSLNAFGADAYRVSLPLASLADALIATHMNGQPLTPLHGFPARLIVPGLTDSAMPRWLQRLEIGAEPVDSAAYRVPTVATLLQPHHHQTLSGAVELTGIAFAGDRPIQAVAINVDDAGWMPVPITSSDAATTWLRWHIRWSPPAPGHYRIAVRAQDSTGVWSADHNTVIHVSLTHS
jgi:DMSO/TMAO reductase YedYZ molybdopterin-dependent catalytic subunit